MSLYIQKQGKTTFKSIHLKIAAILAVFGTVIERKHAFFPGPAQPFMRRVCLCNHFYQQWNFRSCELRLELY